jgi:hypothetical protein
MTAQGTVVALVGIVVLIVLVVRLTMSGRLYAGYAAVWLTCLAVGVLLLLVPPLMRLVTMAVGAMFPVSAVTFLALIFIFLVLIYFSCQLTILSNRVTAVAQHIALNDVGNSQTSPGANTSHERCQ